MFSTKMIHNTEIYTVRPGQERLLLEYVIELRSEQLKLGVEEWQNSFTRPTASSIVVTF